MAPLFNNFHLENTCKIKTHHENIGIINFGFN